MLDYQSISAYLGELECDGITLDHAELMRYRTLANTIKLQPNKRTSNLQAGIERSAIKGRGMEFDEARSYQPGDDIRSIDWRVTARTGKPHTKVFREERERPVFVYVDLSNTMRFGTELLLKSIQASHLAALLGFSAIKRGDKIGGVIFNETIDVEIKPKTRNRGILGIIDALVQNHKLSSQDHRENTALGALRRLQFVSKPGALIHLISDFSQFHQDHFDIVGTMARHCEISANQIFDPFEIELPTSNNHLSLNVTDGTVSQTIDFSNVKSNSQYHQRSLEHRKTLKNRFSELGIALKIISCGLPLTEQLTINKNGYVVGQPL
ncbi:MAG: DUF58 domain-containing protein [Pseudomonadota bacterium]